MAAQAVMGISKRERTSEVRLERQNLKRRDLLILRRGLCNGCGLCVEICLKNALNVTPMVAKDGGLSRLPVVDVDEKKCILCGVCATLCPLSAMEARVNDEKTSMFAKNGIVPSLIKSIKINKGLCEPNCGSACERSCRRNAIIVDVERENGQVMKISDIKVDTDLCIYCRACEDSCPYKAITVERPFEGSLSIDLEKCPPNCHMCADICPSNAIEVVENGTVKVNRKICVFCRACQKICPCNAIHVNIDRVSHTPISSSTWINLLERFSSYLVATKELVAKSKKKQRSIVENRLPQAK